MNQNTQIIIVGGGLAGLTAALHLLKNNCQVLLIEKQTYPKHKVCGEFISNEILPYLSYLDVDIELLQPTHISKTSISTHDGDQISSDLSMGGFGVSRFALDFYLYKEMILKGGVVAHATVQNIVFENDEFTLQTTENQYFKSKIVLGCFGKRSSLDLQMKRSFIQKKSPWLAVKAHYHLPFDNDLVELHNFNGGYCGVSKVENNLVNICYLVQYEVFKQYKNIETFQKNVFAENPKLNAIFEQATLVFEKPLTISQISFEQKTQVENHVLMLGDTAGLIHPLCGNGMAMAIHSAKIASELCLDFLQNTINRGAFENEYKRRWNHAFKSRLRMGKWLSKILLNKRLSRILFQILLQFPAGLDLIIRKTHGKKLGV